MLKQGFNQVYFARIRRGAKTYIKIGVTSNHLAARIGELRRWRPTVSIKLLYAVAVADVKDEIWFHHYFGDRLAFGSEWFHKLSDNEIKASILEYLKRDIVKVK